MEEKMIPPLILLLAILTPIYKKQLIVKYQKVMGCDMYSCRFLAALQLFNCQQKGLFGYGNLLFFLCYLLMVVTVQFSTVPERQRLIVRKGGIWQDWDSSNNCSIFNRAVRQVKKNHQNLTVFRVIERII
jgi:hypothetical protein